MSARRRGVLIPPAMKTLSMMRGATKAIARSSFSLPRDRVEDDGGPDVRDDEKQLEEGSQVNLVVLAAPGDVPGRVVKDRLEERQRRDRGDEREQKQRSEDARDSL